MNAELEEVIFNDAFSYRDHVSELEHTCYFICEKQKLEVKNDFMNDLVLYQYSEAKASVIYDNCYHIKSRKPHK